MTKELAIVEPGAFALFNPNMPAIGEILAANLEGEKLDGFDLDRIKVPSGGAVIWELPSLEGPQYEKELHGIIAMSLQGRSYWANGLEDSGGGTPPDCSSGSGDFGHGDPGGPCETCPMNEFGSSGKGDGKACKEFRSVFLVLPGTAIPTVLAVPPSSLKAFKQYRLRLAAAGFDMSSVITKFTLTKAKNKQGVDYAQINFTKGASLSPEQAAKMRDYIASIGPIFGRVHNATAANGAACDPDTAATGANPFDKTA